MEAPERPSRLGTCLRRLAPPMRETCLCLQILAAVLAPAVLRLLPTQFPDIRPCEWVAHTVVLRFCFSPQSFFRVNAFCWAVDDDCHRGHGRRREAVCAGVVRFFEDQGRSLGMVLFIGLGLMGMRTDNCEALCEVAADVADCVETCERQLIASQPTEVLDFVTGVLTWVLPAFSLMCAIHIWLFPITGERLRQLQDTQARSFKNLHSPAATSSSQPSSVPSGPAAAPAAAASAPLESTTTAPVEKATEVDAILRSQLEAMSTASVEAPPQGLWQPVCPSPRPRAAPGLRGDAMHAVRGPRWQQSLCCSGRLPWLTLR